jgi:hypothetical protein
MLTAGRRSLLLAVVIAVLSAICIAEGVSMKRNSIQMLFIGNSYTFVNAMPSTLDQLSALAHDTRPIRCTMAAEGNATLESHWNSPKTRVILRSRKWDAVTLRSSTKKRSAYILSYGKIWIGNSRRPILCRVHVHGAADV